MKGARVLFLLALAGCAGAPPQPTEPASAPAPRSGGYYKDDGPGERVPGDLAAIPDAQPRAEPLNRFANRPYEVFGKRYVPLASVQPFHQRGMASWYGRRFHGQKTSSGEPYDMYAMTAAHPTLPIPSYARVTRVATGASVVVRINDRGPFHAGRIIDLSYAAAARLGILQTGRGEVEVDAIVPGAPQTTAGAAAQDSPSGAVFLQVGAFAVRENAEKFRAALPDADAGEVVQREGLWRVRLGPYASEAQARSAADALEPVLRLRPLIVR